MSEAIGWHHLSCASTQQLARDWAAGSTDEGQPVAVHLADHQTAGLGREGRSWSDEPGRALQMSIAVREPVPRAKLEELTVHVANVIRLLLERHAPGAIKVKHPNDLVAGGRKLGGVLADSRSTGQHIDWVIVGLGVNLRGPQFDVDGTPATTLEAITGMTIAASGLVVPVVQAVTALLGHDVQGIDWQT